MSGTGEKTSNVVNLVASNAASDIVVPTLHELLTADPDQFVARFTDIAAVNLACARGLPNCNENAFTEYLALLDTIADAVKKQTERSWRLFKIKPQEFHHSENVFRIYTMEYVFRSQFGVKYDPKVREATATGKPWTTTDSSEIFIHGLLSEKRAGTCSSLPTFAIAVGRRLGYPLHLVLVPNHTLYRWDDGKEVFNLQPHEAGGEVKPDDYFHTWPRKWDEVDFQINARTKVWLHSMTPRREVSKFLCNRALMLRDCRRFNEAMQAIGAAQRFDPINPACAEIQHTIEYGMAGGNARHLVNGCAPAPVEGANLRPFPPSMQPAVVGVPAWSASVVIDSLTPTSDDTRRDKECLDRKIREDRAFSEEHHQLVKAINESTQNRSPQHPNGHPSTELLMRQLNQLLQYRKGH